MNNLWNVKSNLRIVLMLIKNFLSLQKLKLLLEKKLILKKIGLKKYNNGAKHLIFIN